MEITLKEKTYNPHYLKYRDSIIERSRSYYKNNRKIALSNMKIYSKECYDDPEKRKKKLIQMKAYRDKKKKERLNITIIS